MSHQLPSGKCSACVPESYHTYTPSCDAYTPLPAASNRYSAPVASVKMQYANAPPDHTGAIEPACNNHPSPYPTSWPTFHVPPASCRHNCEL